MSNLPAADCYFLTGATASGKTSVGVALARRLGGEILSLDSMALYRGLDIGTAKPAVEERRGVPHHLLDVIAPCEEYSLAQYVEAAEALVARIRSAGGEPLFVGGTPLYLKGLLRGIFRGPPADPAFRRELQQQAAQQPPGFLHARLARVDPRAAERLHPNDARRLIRALEVFEKTGRPIRDGQRQFDRARPAEACRVFVLDWPREKLNQRITRRVDAMFAAGLVDEVRRLLDAPGGLGKTAGQAVGYREVVEHLAGRLSLLEAIEQVKLHTRRLAKRQGAWFRSLSECRFVPVGEGDHPEQLAGRIVKMAGRGRPG